MKRKVKTFFLFSIILVIQFIGLFIEFPSKGVIIFSLSLLLYFLAVSSMRSWQEDDN